MIFLRAGLYAEGPTDYRFLGPLIERALYELGVAMLPGLAYVGETCGIDAPRSAGRRREDRISAAIDAYWAECTLFVVHSDGGGDPDGARCNLIHPGIVKAREKRPDLAVASCVPVREVEAWMLADTSAFKELVGAAPRLPSDPEADPDPKATLKRAFVEVGAKPQMVRDAYRFFGQNVQLNELRRLVAFHAFEAELRIAIQAVSGGSRGRVDS